MKFHPIPKNKRVYFEHRTDFFKVRLGDLEISLSLGKVEMLDVHIRWECVYNLIFPCFNFWEEELGIWDFYSVFWLRLIAPFFLLCC